MEQLKQLLDFKNFVLPYTLIAVGAGLAITLASLWAYDYGFSTGKLLTTQELVGNQRISARPLKSNLPPIVAGEWKTIEIKDLGIRLDVPMLWNATKVAESNSTYYHVGLDMSEPCLDLYLSKVNSSTSDYIGKAIKNDPTLQIYNTVSQSVGAAMAKGYEYSLDLAYGKVLFVAINDTTDLKISYEGRCNAAEIMKLAEEKNINARELQKGTQYNDRVIKNIELL